MPNRHLINGKDDSYERLTPKIPRFFVPMSPIMSREDNVITGVYLKNVLKVDDINVEGARLDDIYIKMRKLLTLSQTEKTINFTPVDGASEMHIGFLVSPSYVSKHRFCAIVGHTFWKCGQMTEYDAPEYTRIAWKAKEVIPTWDDSSGTYPDQVDPPTPELNYFDSTDSNPYTGDALDLPCQGHSEMWNNPNDDGYQRPSKDGIMIWGYAHNQLYTDAPVPEDFDGFDFDEDGIVDWDDIANYDVNPTTLNCLYLSIKVNQTDYPGSTLTQNATTGATGFNYDLANLVWGDTWISPHAIDMDYTMSIDFDGNTTRRGIGGHTISNQLYRSAPGFGKSDHWVGWSNHGHMSQRMGRRSWSMTLSYLNDYHLNGKPDQSTLHYYNTSYNTMKNEQNFFTRVVNYTMGSHYPFIFQPNLYSDSNFAICRFDQDQISITPSGPHLYQVPLTITESW